MDLSFCALCRPCTSSEPGIDALKTGIANAVQKMLTTGVLKDPVPLRYLKAHQFFLDRAADDTIHRKWCVRWYQRGWKCGILYKKMIHVPDWATNVNSSVIKSNLYGPLFRITYSRSWKHLEVLFLDVSHML